MSGKMDKFMKDNGLMVLNMVQVYGEEQKEIPTLDSGVKVELMDMEYILG